MNHLYSFEKSEQREKENGRRRKKGLKRIEGKGEFYFLAGSFAFFFEGSGGGTSPRAMAASRSFLACDRETGEGRMGMGETHVSLSTLPLNNLLPE